MSVDAKFRIGRNMLFNLRDFIVERNFKDRPTRKTYRMVVMFLSRQFISDKPVVKKHRRNDARLLKRRKFAVDRGLVHLCSASLQRPGDLWHGERGC